MSILGHFPTTRLRRLRQNTLLRRLVRETRLELGNLILPLFIKYGKNFKKPIPSMPGHFQLSLDRIEQEVDTLISLRIKNIILFGIPEKKDPFGKDAYSAKGIVQQAIKIIKKVAPQLLIITDVCFCEYMDHGHCGVVIKKAKGQIYDIDNDKTLELLAKQAISHAEAGADVIAPSGMMDGMVHAIRTALDAKGFIDTPILSYSAKYSSAFYGPFREAAEGVPHFGDRCTHQLDYANSHEAIRECALDINEGADMLMVKPALTYLDIINRVKQQYPSLPLGAYHTSGEYAMLKAAAEKGWLDEKAAVFETLTAIRRAGADFIISYFTRQVAEWLK